MLTRGRPRMCLLWMKDWVYEIFSLPSLCPLCLRGKSRVSLFTQRHREHIESTGKECGNQLRLTFAPALPPDVRHGSAL